MKIASILTVILSLLVLTAYSQIKHSKKAIDIYPEIVGITEVGQWNDKDADDAISYLLQDLSTSVNFKEFKQRKSPVILAGYLRKEPVPKPFERTITHNGRSTVVTSKLDPAVSSQAKSLHLQNLNEDARFVDEERLLDNFLARLLHDGLAKFVESGNVRDQIRKERVEQQDFAAAESVAKWGRETGANLMLFGDISSKRYEITLDYDQKKNGTLKITSYAYYILVFDINFYLVDVETNERTWFGKFEKKKLLSRNTIAD